MTPYPMKKEPMQIFAREMAVKDQEIAALKAEVNDLESGYHPTYPWGRRSKMYDDEIAALQAKLEAAESESARWEDGCRDYKSRLEAAERVVEAAKPTAIGCGHAWLVRALMDVGMCADEVEKNEGYKALTKILDASKALAAKTPEKPQPQERIK